jgi:hypothetical protein
MAPAVEINVTYRGFELTARGRTCAFASLADAFNVAKPRMEAAQQRSEVSRRCE